MSFYRGALARVSVEFAFRNYEQALQLLIEAMLIAQELKDEEALDECLVGDTGLEKLISESFGWDR